MARAGIRAPLDNKPPAIVGNSRTESIVAPTRAVEIVGLASPEPPTSVMTITSDSEATAASSAKGMRSCFGWFMPFFFVGSGLKFDVGAFVQSLPTMLLVPVFLALFLFVRGAPVFLYRKDLAPQRSAICCHALCPSDSAKETATIGPTSPTVPAPRNNCPKGVSS